MDIRHLIYFTKVAQLKSFTKAAKALYITQPTISKMVKSIEEETGISLFDRSGKEVTLTDAGEVLYKRAQDIIRSFDRLTLELDELRSLKRGMIRIGLPPMVGSSIFPKVIGRFRDQFPKVNIDLVEDGSKKVESNVDNGELDIGVVLLPIDQELFHSFSLIKEKLMLIVHPHHPLSGRKKVKLIELAEESFIFFSKDFALHGGIIEECVKAGFQPHIIYESSQWDFISEMVAENLGVALLPRPICNELDPERVKVIELTDPVIPWHLAMIWRKDRYLSFAAREWIRFTQQYFKSGKIGDGID
ncbi:MAG: cidABC operon transcriptional activator CidR [Tuberibacillus sp.]